MAKRFAVARRDVVLLYEEHYHSLSQWSCPGQPFDVLVGRRFTKRAKQVAERYNAMAKA